MNRVPKRRWHATVFHYCLNEYLEGEGESVRERERERERERMRDCIGQ